MSESTVKTNKPPRYHSFGLVLYPDCEPHVRLLDYFQRRPNMFKPVWILHDKDVYLDEDMEQYKQEHNGDIPNWSVGDRKKPHWHVMITEPQATICKSVEKFLGLNHVEGINNTAHYLSYMLHDTPESWHKHQYQVSELMGDMKQIKKVMTQNPHFV